jgi:hypothetical protein
MLARHLAREGRADEAIAVGSDLTDVRQRTEILTELRRLLVADGRPADALRATLAIGQAPSRREAIASLVAAPDKMAPMRSRLCYDRPRHA